jgi:hypothetical protein
VVKISIKVFKAFGLAPIKIQINNSLTKTTPDANEFKWQVLFLLLPIFSINFMNEF